jgi:hypothetical protein
LSLIIQDSKNTKLMDNGKVMLTDENGKEIIVDMNDINDASTYSKGDIRNIENFNKNMVNIQSKIEDEAGNVINERDLINDVKNGDVTALDVTFEATHSGRRINYALYNSESMAEDCASFMQPFAKPLIKNHDRHTEPLGRIVNVNFDKSEFLEDSDTINATFRVSDQDAMEKFADGRYKTMSIGAGANKIVCNTCGKTILDSGKMKFCGHWRGETYKDSVCTWTMTGLDYREGSVVNDPADEYAQVKRIKVLRKGDSKMSDESKKEQVTNSAVNDIDNILNGVEPTATTEPTNNATDSEGATQEPAAQEPTAELTDAEKITKLEADLKQAQDELEAEKTANTEALAAKDSEIEVLKADKLVVDNELATRKEQLVSLAKLNKQLLTDNLMTLNPELKDEEVADKSAAELNQMITDFKATQQQEPAQRTQAKLNDPGAKINDQNTIVEGEEVIENNKESKKTINTMKDMVDGVMNSLLNI